MKVSAEKSAQKTTRHSPFSKTHERCSASVRFLIYLGADGQKVWQQCSARHFPRYTLFYTRNIQRNVDDHDGETPVGDTPLSEPEKTLLSPSGSEGRTLVECHHQVPSLPTQGRLFSLIWSSHSSSQPGTTWKKYQIRLVLFPTVIVDMIYSLV